VRHEQEQRWREADRTFAMTLKHLPDSQILRAARKQLHERRVAREQFARAELLINHGEQLLKDARVYAQIAQLKPANLFTRLEIGVYKREREKIAAQLFEYGQLASQRMDTALARRCLMVADQLHGTEAIRGALLALNTRDSKNRSVSSSRQASRSSQHTRGFQVQLERYRKTLTNDDLLTAQQQLNNLQRHYPANGELQLLAVELQVLIGTKVSTTVERGKLLYSQGEVQQALHLWQDVLPLDPDNAVLKHNIQRAQRVLENIKVLRERQSG
jgi:tetratricopeptide (TPR) repeat protein